MNPTCGWYLNSRQCDRLECRTVQAASNKLTGSLFRF